MTGVVVKFPGRPLVGVLVERDEFIVMLAKVGAKAASRQVSYPTLAEAEAEAKEGAALCGWHYVGVFDEARLRQIADPFDRGGAAA